MLAITLGKPFTEVAGLWDASAHRVRELDLILFDDWFRPTIWYQPWTNTFGNIALFLPVGAVIAYSQSRRPILTATVVGAGFSLLIEVAQYVFALGYTDVDDVLLNTIGAALGAWGLGKLRPSLRTTALWTIGVGALVVLIVMASGLQ